MHIIAQATDTLEENKIQGSKQNLLFKNSQVQENTRTKKPYVCYVFNEDDE